MELVVKSGEQDNYSLVQLQCMQELPRQSLGFYQKFKQENVVGSKMKQLELQPQEKTEMDNRAGRSIALDKCVKKLGTYYLMAIKTTAL